MNITKEMLKQIIKEELEELNRSEPRPQQSAAVGGRPRMDPREIEKRKTRGGKQQDTTPLEATSDEAWEAERARLQSGDRYQRMFKLLKQALELTSAASDDGWQVQKDLKKIIKSVARLGYSEKEVATRTPRQKQVAQALEKGDEARARREFPEDYDQK